MSKQKFDFTCSFFYLLGLEDQFSTTEDIVMHLDTFGSPQRDSACFWRCVAVTSNHLDISSVWKSLLAICVYMVEA